MKVVVNVYRDSDAGIYRRIINKISEDHDIETLMESIEEFIEDTFTELEEEGQ